MISGDPKKSLGGEALRKSRKPLFRKTVMYSGKLSQVARYFFRPPSVRFDVYIHCTKSGSRELKVAVVEGTLIRVQDKVRFGKPPVDGTDLIKVKGTGTAESESTAFIKALVELGESYLVRELKLPHRCGLAGAFFLDQATLRAKAELIERDSFLYHYRNHVPFSRLIEVVSIKEACKGLYLYQMVSADPFFNAVFATDENGVNGVGPCLLMGLGSHPKLAVAKAKAKQEYLVMALDHKQRPGWCEELFKSLGKVERLPDLHHCHSRDIRNLNRISSICKKAPRGKDPDGPNKSSERILSRQIRWEEKRLPSPLRFVKYIQVVSPDLATLDFGHPEPRETWGSIEPLYHPVW